MTNPSNGNGTPAPPVTADIVVPLSPQDAYNAFVHEYGKWIPTDFSIGAAPVTDVVVEDTVNGRWFERAADGSETDWGVIREVNDPSSITMTWNIGPDWAFHPDLDRASTVTTTFEEEAGDRSRVRITHADFERHGEGWQELRDQMDGEYGYQMTLARYADYCTQVAGSDRSSGDATPPKQA